MCVYDTLDKAILYIIYFNGGKISKTKLVFLLYLLSNKIENLKEELDPYLNLIPMTLEDFFVNIYLGDFSAECELIYNLSDKVELKKKGYKYVKKLLKESSNNELNIIKELVDQYKDVSDKDIIRQILENLKHT
jgi:hypothetical protein